MLWQPLQNHPSGDIGQNHPSGNIGEWAMPWLAEEMLDGQHQRVDIAAHTRTTHNGLLQRDWKRSSAELVLTSPRRPNRSRDWTELNWTNYLSIRHLFLVPIHSTSILVVCMSVRHAFFASIHLSSLITNPFDIFFLLPIHYEFFFFYSASLVIHQSIRHPVYIPLHFSSLLIPIQLIS